MGLWVAFFNELEKCKFFIFVFLNPNPNPAVWVVFSELKKFAGSTNIAKQGRTMYAGWSG